MNQNIYIAADNIISPLGFTVAENFNNLKNGITGVQYWEDSILSTSSLYAALINRNLFNEAFKSLDIIEEYTRLEQMVILSITNALGTNPAIDITSSRTLLILSTTKGNIDLLDPSFTTSFDKKRLLLWETPRVVARHFRNPNRPLVVSNACISGVLAIIVAKRFLLSGQYDTVIVTGADLVSRFVVTGFQAFKALSSQVAKPFDKDRDGINLGEAAGTIVLTNKSDLTLPGEKITIRGGASSNDANHISGPSRTGDGLLTAIQKTLQESEMNAGDVDYICGHGTATIYNDEMEALAINDANLQHVPLNSLKGYFGHTLGAAGIIESIIALQSMRENVLVGTYNFTTLGVTKTVNMVKCAQKATVNNCLKTAAGFGGCNAAVFFQKKEN